MNYYVINTNRKANPEGQDEKQMLTEKVVSLYFEGHKENIEKLNTGDIVFLYSNESGVIACGEVSGKTLKRPYKGLTQFNNEEYYQKFTSFYEVRNPLSVKQMTSMFGKKPFVVRSFNPLNEIQGLILFDSIVNTNVKLRVA